MKKKSLNIIDILKYFVALLFIVYIAILISSKGANDISIDIIQKNILSATSISGMKEGSSQDLKRLYGLNSNDYDGVMLYIPDDVMSVNEILVIKLKDNSQFDSVESAVNKRIETQRTNFEGYGVEQTKLINSAIIQSKGNYILMAVSNDADNIYTAFKKSL